MQGWISLHRKIMSHPFYMEKRKFSKYEAWIDILLMANHQDNKFIHGNKLVEVGRGSFITSELKLMERWDWGKEKLRSFLKLLEHDGMIVKISDRKQTTIKVLHYGEYQTSPDHKQTVTRPLSDHEQTAVRPSPDTNNNVNNANKEIKEDAFIVFDHWNTKKIIIHRKMTGVMKGHINARFNELTADEIVAAIDNYHAIINDGNMYWYSHKFTLQDFMNPKNLDRFLNENNPFETYKRNVVTFGKQDKRADNSDHKMRLQQQMEERNEYAGSIINY